MAPTKDPRNNGQVQAIELISLEAASKVAGLSHPHLALLIRRGELWGMKIGRNWVTTEKALNDYQSKALKPGRKPKNLPE